jgi:hypothetical protein
MSAVFAQGKVFVFGRVGGKMLLQWFVLRDAVRHHLALEAQFVIIYLEVIVTGFVQWFVWSIGPKWLRLA